MALTGGFVSPDPRLDKPLLAGKRVTVPARVLWDELKRRDLVGWSPLWDTARQVDEPGVGVSIEVYATHQAHEFDNQAEASAARQNQLQRFLNPSQLGQPGETLTWSTDEQELLVRIEAVRVVQGAQGHGLLWEAELRRADLKTRGGKGGPTRKKRPGREGVRSAGAKVVALYPGPCPAGA